MDGFTAVQNRETPAEDAAVTNRAVLPESQF